MELLQGDRFWLFFFFALPGLIGVYAWDLLVPTDERKAPEQLLRGITFSIVNTVLVWPIAERLGPSAPAWVFRIATAFVLLVFPVLEAVALRALLSWGRFRAIGGLRHPTPGPWDHFFGLGETCWLVMHLKSGHKVAGYFGMKSFASSFPHPEQVYIQELWALDPADDRRFVYRAPRSHGAIVSMAECESIEFFTDEPETK